MIIAKTNQMSAAAMAVALAKVVSEILLKPEKLTVPEKSPFMANQN